MFAVRVGVRVRVRVIIKNGTLLMVNLLTNMQNKHITVLNITQYARPYSNSHTYARQQITGKKRERERERETERERERERERKRERQREREGETEKDAPMQGSK
jgi:Ni/Co efflux regulator RcnB